MVCRGKRWKFDLLEFLVDTLPYNFIWKPETFWEYGMKALKKTSQIWEENQSYSTAQN